ncbi:hypothetical protein [Salipaludibacillus sp. CF4.18]|uniref:hypothetical protein n=1 Tax=Salipaludibacillus sp. CF4.18 TaxID=3373081 RepID=UPI003EE78D8E
MDLSFSRTSFKSFKSVGYVMSAVANLHPLEAYLDGNRGDCRLIIAVLPFQRHLFLDVL